MSNSIISISMAGISKSGISSQAVNNQLVNQLTFNQLSMYQLETEISSGHQYQLPSENPVSALQVMGIQSLLERKDQLKTNISTNQNYLKQTDSTLSSVASLLISVQSTALGAIGTTTTDSQRQAVVEQINAAVQQLVSLGNTQFNGQQLFSGTATTTAPFSFDSAGNVIYSGNSTPTASYANLNQLFATSVTGDQAFGAMSQPVQGSALLTSLSSATLLSNLNGGQGVAAGSIAVSDGHSTSIVDLRSAHTLGDVAALIHQNPPAGRIIDVNVTSTGLTLNLEPDPVNFPNGDNLTVQEVNGNTTASNLGILNTVGVGPGPLVGQTLTSAIQPTTPLNDLFGTRAQANIHFGQPNSDIVIEANSTGTATSGGTLLNGVTVQVLGDQAIAGTEFATFNPGTPTTPGVLTVHMSTSAVSPSRAGQLVAAINNIAGLPFTASLDPSDENGGAQQPIMAAPAPTTTTGGSGTTFDPTGLQITSAGKTYTVDFSAAKTVQDLLNGINGTGAGLDAEINPARTGIDIRSRVSGANFAIGENGGTTAAQLGIRTFTTATQLSQLNLGAGVGRNAGTSGGNDFTISETINGANIQVPISIAKDLSVGDVLQNINSAAQNAGATFTAQLTTTGNGIELVDNTHGPIVVTADPQSSAAVDLGLIPKGQTTATSTANTSIAIGTEASKTNNELLIQAINPAATGVVQVAFQANAGVTKGNETVLYDSVAQTLTFQISPQTTANDIIAALAKDPVANAAFTATRDTSREATNSGNGIVQPQQVQTVGGTAAFGSNSELFFEARNPGSTGDVQISFQANAGITQGNETVQYDPTAKTLTFQISPQSTANDIIAALQKNTTANAAFFVWRDTSSDPNNNGSGIIQPQQVYTNGGGSILTGSDPNPQQTDSIFNALLRLGTALKNNDTGAVQQAMTWLSNSMQNLGNARNELGVHEQALSVINTQITNEELNLQSAMSTNYDTDMANAISNYTAAQISYQATLQMTASVLKMTLLNYL